MSQKFDFFQHFCNFFQSFFRLFYVQKPGLRVESRFRKKFMNETPIFHRKKSEKVVKIRFFQTRYGEKNDDPPKKGRKWLKKPSKTRKIRGFFDFFLIFSSFFSVTFRNFSIICLSSAFFTQIHEKKVKNFSKIHQKSHLPAFALKRVQIPGKIAIFLGFFPIFSPIYSTFWTFHSKIQYFAIFDLKIQFCPTIDAKNRPFLGGGRPTQKDKHFIKTKKNDTKIANFSKKVKKVHFATLA